MSAMASAQILTSASQDDKPILSAMAFLSDSTTLARVSAELFNMTLGKANIRVNAVSAGPIKTLAARGIGGLSDMMKAQAERSPIPRNVDVNEVAATAVFLASQGGTGITGETIYVDCGYNIMGF